MEAKPHIGFMSNTSWSMYNFRLGVLRHFLRKGFRVTIMAPRDSYSDKLIAEGVNFINIPLQSYSTNVFSDIKLLRSLQGIYKRENFAFVFHYTIKPNIYGSLIARIQSIPCIAVTTGMGRTFQFRKTLVQKIVNKAYAVSTASCKEIWTLNEGDKHQLVSAHIAPPSRIRVLPSEGINVNKFRPSLKAHAGLNLRFLFAGRLLIDKGIRHYIEAARIITSSHSNVKFEVLGFLNPKNDNCITKEELLEYQATGVINYLGSTEDIRPYLDRADCVVFPSFYHEGVSRILMEAASMATPIITSDQVGCQELVNNRVNGFLFEKQNLADLVLQITTFISLNNADRRAMGIAGRELVKTKYQEHVIIEIYNTLIQKILNIANQESGMKINFDA